MELIIGLRGSKLSLVQGESLRKMLSALGLSSSLKVIKTTGDKRSQGAKLKHAQDKQEWVAEIEEALQFKEIDLALHSGKDVPVGISPGSKIEPLSNIASREDIFISSESFGSVEEIPEGLKIGTSSERRKKQLQRLFKVPEISPIRGNIDTRLKKLEEGSLDGIVLAKAGIERLGLTPSNSIQLPFLTAVAQGILAMQYREEDLNIAQLIPSLTSEEAQLVFATERLFIEKIGADCHSAVGVRAKIKDDLLTLQCDVFQPDGGHFFEGEVAGDIAASGQLVDQLAEELFFELGHNLFGGA